MWRNADVLDFVGVWRNHNEHSPRAGFYGLDLYSLYASIRAVLDFLDRADPLRHGSAESLRMLDNFGYEHASIRLHDQSFGLSRVATGSAEPWMEMRRRSAEIARRDGASSGMQFLRRTKCALSEECGGVLSFHVPRTNLFLELA